MYSSFVGRLIATFPSVRIQNVPAVLFVHAPAAPENSNVGQHSDGMLAETPSTVREYELPPRNHPPWNVFMSIARMPIRRDRFTLALIQP